MKRNFKLFIVLIVLGIVLVSIFTIWSISQNKISYEEPQEALLAENKNLILIPAYKKQGEALYFFIKDSNNIGAAMVKKGLFGWKSDYLVWSTTVDTITDEQIRDYQTYGEEIIFGLMKNGQDLTVMIDDMPSGKINLEVSLYKESVEMDLKNVYLWYFETDNLSNINELQLHLVNQNTNEKLDSYPFTY
ncbi:aspartyl-tRNA synthetase [Metaplanococcus flavidus]|uniref:Aspartyl-tRNA synthetase n=1 Tax=Metaplanococcus flavidus TaxID=569883 RepID=A0ABW3LHD1_9BACL